MSEGVSENEIAVIVSVDCAFNDHPECNKDLCQCSCHALVKQALSAQLATIATAVGELSKVELWGGTDVVIRADVLKAIDEAQR